MKLAHSGTPASIAVERPPLWALMPEDPCSGMPRCCRACDTASEMLWRAQACWVMKVWLPWRRVRRCQREERRAQLAPLTVGHWPSAARTCKLSKRCGMTTAIELRRTQVCCCEHVPAAEKDLSAASFFSLQMQIARFAERSFSGNLSSLVR